jgi:hypothetical protein
VLGEDHPDTLTTRSNLAHLTGESGDVTGAIEQYRDLLQVQQRVLGEDHPDTLLTRSNLASWTDVSDPDEDLATGQGQEKGRSVC